VAENPEKKKKIPFQGETLWPPNTWPEATPKKGVPKPNFPHFGGGGEKGGDLGFSRHKGSGGLRGKTVWEKTLVGKSDFLGGKR